MFTTCANGHVRISMFLKFRMPQGTKRHICKTANNWALVLEELWISHLLSPLKYDDDSSLYTEFLRYLKAVDVRENYFTVDKCKILKDTILNAAEDNTLVLKEINVSECGLQEEPFVILADCISYLKIVHLSSNGHSGLEGVSAVNENIKAASMNATEIGQNPTLQHL